MSEPTNPPSEEELTRYIVERLGGFSRREDLILDVCQLMEWEWNRTDLFIKAVQEKHFRRIALGQSPWFLAIALAILIPGIVLTGASSIFLWTANQEARLTDVSVMVRAPRIVYALIIGICMTVGSSAGVWVFLRQVVRGR
jgi:hypothetical protein